MPVSKTKDSPVRKVKESPVKNLNETPPKKSKRSHNVSTAIRKLNFASVEEESIESLYGSREPLLPSEETDQTLCTIPEKPENNLPAERTLESRDNKWVKGYQAFKRYIRKSLSLFGDKGSKLPVTTPEKEENGLHFEKTPVSRDLSTSGAVSDCREPSGTEVMENTLPLKENFVSMDMFTITPNETFSDSADILAMKRRMQLCSGGTMTSSEPIEKSDLFNRQLVTCFHCQKNSFVYPAISKHKLVCKIHEDDDFCPFKSDTEKFQEIPHAPQTKKHYLTYSCIVCGCISYDLRSLKSGLKCSHCWEDFILCERCSLFSPIVLQ